MKRFFFSKLVQKATNTNLSEMIAGSSGRVQNVPTDFRKGFGAKIERYMGAICLASGGECSAKCSIWAQMPRFFENDEKCAQKPKNQNCQNWSREAQNKSKSPHGLPKTFKLNKLTQTSTFINMIMKTFYIPSKLEYYLSIYVSIICILSKTCWLARLCSH